MSIEGQVRQGVVVFDGPAPLPEGTRVRVEPLNGAARAPASPRNRVSLADWAEQNAEDWGNQLNSEDVERFTGRRL
jgi:hypothetical protein